MEDLHERYGITDGESRYELISVQYPTVVTTDHNEELVSVYHGGKHQCMVMTDTLYGRCKEKAFKKGLCYYHFKVHKRIITDMFRKRQQR